MLADRPPWIVLFHIVSAGSCRIELDTISPGTGEGVVHAEQGDVVIFPHAHAHVMAGEGGHERGVPTPVSSLLPPERGAGCPVLTHGAGVHVTTRLVCGYLRGEERFAPLARALPPLLLLRPRGSGIWTIGTDRDARALSIDATTRDWIETSLRYALHEAERGNAGADSMLARLTEILFVQVLHSYADQSQSGTPNWLTGLRDVHVGKALELLHRDPAHPWNVEELARGVGLSRSALGERFTQLLGEPPMRYLAAWRMHVARTLMRDPRLGLSEIAGRVGYESEAAFHRAFKRDSGETPALWRKRHASSAV